jgi:GxxExxY protein
MDAQEFAGAEAPLTKKIIDVFYEVYNELGSGFLESVYCRSLALALEQAGLNVVAELPMPVYFRAVLVGTYRADLVVEQRVILELKTADALTEAHLAQLTHYLRASTIEVGLLLNFGDKPKVKRVEFSNERKRLLRTPLGSVFPP